MNQFKKAKQKALASGHHVENISDLKTAGVKETNVENSKPVQQSEIKSEEEVATKAPEASSELPEMNAPTEEVFEKQPEFHEESQAAEKIPTSDAHVEPKVVETNTHAEAEAVVTSSHVEPETVITDAPEAKNQTSTVTVTVSHDAVSAAINAEQQAPAFTETVAAPQNQASTPTITESQAHTIPETVVDFQTNVATAVTPQNQSTTPTITEPKNDKYTTTVTAPQNITSTAEPQANTYTTTVAAPQANTYTATVTTPQNQANTTTFTEPQTNAYAVNTVASPANVYAASATAPQAPTVTEAQAQTFTTTVAASQAPTYEPTTTKQHSVDVYEAEHNAVHPEYFTERTAEPEYTEPMNMRKSSSSRKSIPNIFSPKGEAKSMRKSLVLKPTSVKIAENYCAKNGGSFNELIQTLLDNFIDEYGL